MKDAAVLVVGSLALAIILSYAYRALLPKRLPGVPYNKHNANKFFGDFPEMSSIKMRRKWIIDIPRSLDAPVAQVLFPLRWPMLIVSDYRAVCDITMRRLKDFDRGSKMAELFGYVTPRLHIVFNTTDPRFRAHRELLRDLMTPGFLHEISAPRIYDSVKELVSLWGAKEAKAGGRAFEAFRDLSSFTLDSIRAVAFGVDNYNKGLLRELSHLQDKMPVIPQDRPDAPAEFSPADLGPEVEALLDMGEVTGMALTSPFPWVTHTLAMMNPRHAKAWLKRKNMITEQTTRSVKKLGEQGESAKANALDQVLWREMNAAKKQQKKPDYYSPVIRDEMLGFLLGGHDTTTTSLSWFVKYIAQYPDVQTRLRRDLRQAYQAAVKGERHPKVDEITSTSVPYLDAVVEETLRVGTVGPVTIRQAMRDTQVLGYPVPKGTFVTVPLTGPGITEPVIKAAEPRGDGVPDPSLPPDWDEDNIGEYRPERWLKTDDSGCEVFDPKAGPVLAFSAGPRACFGKKLAYIELKMTVTLLLWHFEFQAIDGKLGGFEAAEHFTTPPEHVYVKLRRL